VLPACRTAGHPRPLAYARGVATATSPIIPKLPIIRARGEGEQRVTIRSRSLREEERRETLNYPLAMLALALLEAHA
jgi:hypothetical protein